MVKYVNESQEIKEFNAYESGVILHHLQYLYALFFHEVELLSFLLSRFSKKYIG